MRLLLLGCTGFIGNELIPLLLKKGHELIIVGRNSSIRKSLRKNINIHSNNLRYIKLDPANSDNWQDNNLQKELLKIDGIINLVGEPIAEKRWTKSHCELIKQSRLASTKNLIEAISHLERPPKVLINASAIGYYGTNKDLEFTETSSPGKDFLSNLCIEWENIAKNKPKKTRLLIVRIGIVIGSNGGALGKMLPVFKSGFGGPIGDGKQWMSWIHRTDLCRIIEKAVKDNSWSGVINGVAPNPVLMIDFSKNLGKVLNRPSLIAIPGPILKLILGDGAKVVLEGQKVLSIYLNKLNFDFNFTNINQALLDATKQ